MGSAALPPKLTLQRAPGLREYARARPIGQFPDRFVPTPRPVPYDDAFAWTRPYWEKDWGMAKTDEKALEYYYNKFDVPHQSLDAEQTLALKRAEAFVQTLFPGNSYRVAPATHEEVIQAMKPDTACGFPFSGPDYPDKQAFMQLHAPAVLASWREQHDVYTTVAYKVEPLPLEKIERKGCRILRFADVLTIYKQMRLTYRLTELIHLPIGKAMVTWPLTPLLYGFSEQYGGWDRLHQNFAGYNCFGIDGSSYDTSLCIELLQAVCRIVRKCLILNREEDDLYWHLCNSLIVSKCVDNRGRCYRLIGSNCTGQYWTKLWNDLCTLVSIAYTIIRATKENASSALDMWIHNCRAAISGDDALIGTKLTSTIPDLPDALVKYSAELGVKIEVEEKDGATHFASSSQLQFLSTDTVFVDHLGYLPLHQVGKSLCKLAHSRQDDRDPESMYSRIRGAYIALWPHKFAGLDGEIVVAQLYDALQRCKNELPAMHTMRLDDVSDRVMIKLYTGIELQSKVVGPVEITHFKDKSLVYGMPPKSKQPKSMPKQKLKVSKQLQVRQTRRGNRKANAKSYVNEQAQGFSTVDRVSVVRQTGSMLLPNAMQPILTTSINTLGTGALVVPPLLLSPLMLGNNRLAMQASLYSEWKPRSIKLRYVPKVGQFNNGGFLMVYSRDPSYLPMDYATSSTAANVVSLQLCSEQGAKCNTFVASRGTLQCVQPNRWKDGWLKCAASNVGGVISSLFTAGIVYVVMDGAITNNTGTALTGQVGELWLDWDIEFRGETDNVVARTLSQVVNDLTISSVTDIASGSALQFTLNTEHGNATYLGNDVLVVYPGEDFAGTGFSFAENAPMYLRRTQADLFYLAYTTLYDAVNATSGRSILVTGGSPSTAVTVDVATVQPMPQLSFG